tara:strand:- start:3948 stop:4505 length:558 start_codon:yes stop_codon:yes gene_type:complete
MSNERSRDKLMEFLDYLGNKGLMAKATVASRKAAASKLLGILPAEEANDVTRLDLDEVMTRFQNLEGKNYTPGSLTTYLSRARGAIDDFNAYLENPLGFRPSVQSREKRAKSEFKKPVSSNVDSNSTSFGQERAGQKVIFDPTNSILPIPIRADKTVYVQGIPFDLTASEASKIANVIRAMATQE